MVNEFFNEVGTHHSENRFTLSASSCHLTCFLDICKAYVQGGLQLSTEDS